MLFASTILSSTQVHGSNYGSDVAAAGPNMRN
jgi:hypothetical protein